jgi:hypothetical protein
VVLGYHPTTPVKNKKKTFGLAVPSKLWGGAKIQKFKE